jgi:hypothetical protein
MKDIHIILGMGWRQFAFDRDDLAYLGTIRRGIEIGALAQDSAGNYLQVNGDMRQALNKSRIEAKLREAMGKDHMVQQVRQPTIAERAAVTVVIKPRRRVMAPNAECAIAETEPGLELALKAHP